MKTIWYNLLIFFAAYSAFGNIPDSIDLTLKQSKFSLLNHAYYIKSTPDVTVDAVASDVIHNRNIRVFNQFKFGSNDSIVWLIVPIKNSFGAANEYIIEIQNPHIDKLQAYCLIGDKISILGNETGDYFKFNTRYIAHRNFVWPLNACGLEDFNLIIRVEKRNTSLNIPVYIWQNKSHADYSALMNIFYGLCFGMMFVVALYGLIAGFFLKATVYLFYFAFIMVAIVFLATTEGLSFQILYPELEDFNSLFRVSINAIATITFILFSREFLNTKKFTPIINKIFLFDIAILTSLLILTPFLADYFLANSAVMLPIIILLTLIANISCILAALKLLAIQRIVATFYLVAYFVIILSSIISLGEDFGWIEKLPYNLTIIGVLIEIMVFSLALTYQMKKVYDERNDLSLKIARHQREMMQAYVNGIEKERGRIAGELHDDIGSRLGNLRRIVSQSKNENFEHIEKQIETLSDDVRNLSHQLAPIGLRNKGLRQMVTELIIDSQKLTNTEFILQCYDIPDNLPEDVVQQSYRIIQESITNIIKHAQATQADIQLFGHDHEFVITIEDNGIGFNKATNKKGLGHSQIESRAQSLDGKIEISSSINRGTQLMISIPI